MLGENLTGAVYDFVSQWPAGLHHSEPAYRKDLLEYLESNTSGRNPVRKEAGASHADIGIGNRVAVELKYDFRSQGQIDRLFSQIARHQKGFTDGVVCVFCGVTSKKAIDRLKVMIRDSLQRPGLLFPINNIMFVYKGRLE